MIAPRQKKALCDYAVVLHAHYAPPHGAMDDALSEDYQVPLLLQFHTGRYTIPQVHRDHANLVEDQQH
jgi:hypothetical protein